MGRYKGDVYYSGGAYYFSTLGAAEFCFRAAVAASRRAIGSGAATPFSRPCAPSRPPSGDMSEQFDQKTGAQTSARHLAWSYAAFISCVAARRAVAGTIKKATAERRAHASGDRDEAAPDQACSLRQLGMILRARSQARPSAARC